MKILYLLRHAKSSWKDFSLNDYDRPLNKRGKANAPMMAKRFKENEYELDVIISSGALRARTTAEVFAEVLDKKVEFNDAVYEASDIELLEILYAYFKCYDHMMLVGHNPELTELCNYLGDSYIDNIVTCGVVTLRSKGSKLKKGSMHLDCFDYPKK